MKKMYSLKCLAIVLVLVSASVLSPFYAKSQSVTGFTLINADTQQDICPLIDGQVINLSVLSTSKLNIRANTDPQIVGSVRFSYDSDSNFQMENVFPYSLAGDEIGNYKAWIPTTGNHTLTATSYSGPNSTGSTGESLKVIFQVSEDSTDTTSSAVEISGELKKWHKTTLTFDGPKASEDGTPNPAMDYRLDVTFSNSLGESFKVPGYFAADGNAGETGAASGNKWRVHLSPDATGIWTYTASFRRGTNIAVSDVDTAGTAVSPIDGATGTFLITSSDKSGVDLRGKGLLKYTGAPLLQFAETGEYYRKTGCDAPENFLAYDDIDNVSNYNNYRKSWSPHIRDWRSGDPAWHSGTLGKGIIGAINYLSSQGMNSFSFLTMNIKGDDRNVWPYTDTASRTRMDVSKLDQWEIIFSHGDKMGMHLHFKTQEIEGENVLDGGALGNERKIYYRTLIARFSHHLACNWNLGEENTQTAKQQKEEAQYFYDHDPYHHNIVLHTLPGEQELRYTPLLGNASKLTGISIQTDPANVYSETKKWVLASDSAGKRWIVANDEQTPAQTGVAADAEYTGNRGTEADNSEAIRKNVLWGNLMAGGDGVEYYFGYNTGETDLSLQDFRSRAKSFSYCNYATTFFRNYLLNIYLKPENIVSSGWCIAKDSVAYVVYLKNGGSSNITLPAGAYNIKWYNPRIGGTLQNGSVKHLTSGTVSIGYPPSDSSSDWTVLITTATNYPLTVSISNPTNNATFSTSDSIAINADASDKVGSISKVQFYSDNIKLGEDTTSPYSYTWNNASEGLHSITAKVFNYTGDSAVSPAVNIIVTKNITVADSIVFAVNAGDTSYTASNGITYHADTNFKGGKVNQTLDSISNTIDDPLYQSERFGNFSYAIPVKKGTYEITFRFAEIFKTAADERKFDVLAGDSVIISNLDIFAAAGRDNAFDIVKTVTLNDTVLKISFRSDTNYAKLSALHIKALSAKAPVSRPVSIKVAKGETRDNENISIFPNPTKGIITILSKESDLMRIKIYDNKGVNVFSDNYMKKAGQINLSAFSPGIYYIEVLLSDKKISRKIVLTK